MRPYELVVLLHPDLEIDVDAPVAKLEKLIDDNGGKIIKRDNWGKKRLAYPIRKQQFAIYVYFDIQMEPTKVRGLEAGLRITEEVMRFLTVHPIAPSPKNDKAKKTDAPAVAAAAEGDK